MIAHGLRHRFAGSLIGHNGSDILVSSSKELNAGLLRRVQAAPYLCSSFPRHGPRSIASIITLKGTKEPSFPKRTQFP